VYETWSLPLRETYRWGVSENRVREKIFGSYRRLEKTA